MGKNKRSYSRSRSKSQRKDKRNKRKYSSSSSSSSSSQSYSSSSQSQSQSKQSSKHHSSYSREAPKRKQHHQKQQQNQNLPRYKIQQTKTLCIQAIKSQLHDIERILTDVSINAGTSLPDQVELRQGNVYAKYPSIEVSSKVFDHLNGKLIQNNNSYKVYYYPIKKIDLNAAYDWFCDKCDYKNFARRFKCYRCENEKNSNCKVNYNSQPIIQSNPKNRDQNNCSLMIRGPVIMDVEQVVLLDIFQKIAPVKDIRMIKNKMAGKNKDFAFVQFYSPQQTAMALKIASSPDFTIDRQKVSVMYSRNKADDDFIKPLPYERRDRRKDLPKKDKSNEPVENYYRKQRQMQIQLEKQRPLITIQQLKEKRQQQLKKNAPVAKEMSQQQTKRKLAEMQAKQLERQLRMQNSILYICPLCRKKFKGQEEMKAHQKFSQLHKYNMKKFIQV